MKNIWMDNLYCLLGEEFSNGKSNVEVTKIMLERGVKVIQYREKDKSMLYKYNQCVQIRKLTKKAGAMFIVNDDVALGIAVSADGVHIGQDDLPIAEVRKLVGDKMIIGLSTHSPEQAEKAVADGADYIGVGPIYATKTKKDVCDAVGLSYLEYVVKNIDIPFVAIGGIKESNMREVLNSGAKCIAMVTEILGADDIGAKIAKIKEKMVTHAIFDLDGTLLDSMEMWDRLPSDYLLKYNISPPADLNDRIRAWGTLQVANYFIDELNHPGTADAIIQEINDMIVDQYQNQIQLKPFAGELLENLKNRNIKMCIATATDRELVIPALKRLHILQYFEFILTCTEVGSNKETPDIYVMALEKFGVLPQSVVVFEDILTAIQSAKSANFNVIGVHDPSSDIDTEKIKEISDRYVTSFEEFML